MLDIGWSEMLVIAVVLIIVVGPRDLPAVLRSFGKYAGQLRRMAGDFQRQFNDALNEAELSDVRRDIESLRNASPTNQLKSMVSDALDPVRDAGETVKQEATSALALPSTGTATPASASKRNASQSDGKTGGGMADTSRSQAATPKAAKPSTGKTRTVKTRAAKPKMAKPETVKPETAKSAAAKPARAKPAATKRAVSDEAGKK